MKSHQDNTNGPPALLCTCVSVDTLETNSLCCAAAGIIASSSATTEALIHHEKLRGAAPSDATLTTSQRPLAQPALEYTQAFDTIELPREKKTGRHDGPTGLIGRAA